MPVQELRVAFFQTNLVWEDKKQNLAHFERQFSHLKEPVDLVLLPEMFNTGFSINPEKYAENMEGESIAYLKDKAKSLQAVLIASLLVKAGKDFFNRLLTVHPDGRVEPYDKRHLFRLSEEFKIISGGSRRLIVNVKGWKILPLICYDLRFPVWSKNTFTSGNYEYDVLVFVANWPESRTKVWKTLLAARAMDNQAYTIGVNRIGDDGFGTYHSGDSMALDPKGNIIASAPEGKESVNFVTLSRQDLELYRESFTVGLDWDRFTIDLNP
jgi:predicted amidohydrolase